VNDGTAEAEQAGQQRMLVDRVQVAGNRRVPAPGGFGHVQPFVTRRHCAGRFILWPGGNRLSRCKCLARRQCPCLAAPDEFPATTRLGHQGKTHAALLPARVRAVRQQIENGIRWNRPGLRHALRHVDQPQRPKRKAWIAQDGHVQRRRGKLQRQRRQCGADLQAHAIGISLQPGRIERGAGQRAFDARQRRGVLQSAPRMPEKPQRRRQQWQEGRRAKDRHRDAIVA